MWPGFDSRTVNAKSVVVFCLFVCFFFFVVGSHPCSQDFSPGSPIFHPVNKNQHLLFSTDLETASAFHLPELAG